ncbi:helix-turn-helix domain-containing protein [Streptomyces sp. NPDC057654]|uniref:helix-turn-helix domain-containing protein n=1 Tax=Streptomyces sp. NPDC057654 TaxID=3346196 RepID=UPI00369633DD
MSGEAREWVWEHSSSRGAARLVLLSIADRVADEQCVAWASLTSLMERVNASRSTVRDALDRLLDGGELERLDDLVGPQRSTVYRLPLAAKALAHATGEQETSSDAGTTAPDGGTEAVPRLRVSALRRYGIRPREVPDSVATGRNPAGLESGTSRRKPAPRRSGNRHLDGADSGPQNRREPKVNRKYSSGGTALTSADTWQPDPDTHTWARRQGHLDRLGEEGLAAADAKWRAHRAGYKPRPAAAWAADWRSWVAREHPPARTTPHTPHHTGTGSGAGAVRPGGMTRAEAHTAALLAAVGEPTGSE